MDSSKIAEKPQPAPAEPRASDPSPERSCATTQARSITQRSEDVIELSSCWFDWLLTHDRWLKTLRVVPHTDDNGTVFGIKTYGIERSTILGTFGFQNGDFVISINHVSTSKLEWLQAAFTESLHTGRCVVELQRRGVTSRKTFIRAD